jgi:hypothetical protein
MSSRILEGIPDLEYAEVAQKYDITCEEIGVGSFGWIVKVIFSEF